MTSVGANTGYTTETTQSTAPAGSITPENTETTENARRDEVEQRANLFGGPNHSVRLEWTASPSNVIGYNVYRGLSANGPFSKLTPSVEPATVYTDDSVVGGRTYYYVVTAVSTSNESVQSNVVTAVVPSP